jgi:hypothetical protein
MLSGHYISTESNAVIKLLVIASVLQLRLYFRQSHGSLWFPDLETFVFLFLSLLTFRAAWKKHEGCIMKRKLVKETCEELQMRNGVGMG